MAVAGKTGTPERIWKSERINDGWYVFFAPKKTGAGHIVVCVRMEAAKGSSEAVRLAGSYVIPELVKRGYIKGFDEKSSLQTTPFDVPVEVPVADEQGNDAVDTSSNKPRVATKKPPVQKPVEVKPVVVDTSQDR
jgi:hypothetical protein